MGKKNKNKNKSRKLSTKQEFSNSAMKNPEDASPEKETNNESDEDSTHNVTVFDTEICKEISEASGTNEEICKDTKKTEETIRLAVSNKLENSAEVMENTDNTTTENNNLKYDDVKSSNFDNANPTAIEVNTKINLANRKV